MQLLEEKNTYFPPQEGAWAWLETCCFSPETLGVFFGSQ